MDHQLLTTVNGHPVFSSDEGAIEVRLDVRQLAASMSYRSPAGSVYLTVGDLKQLITLIELATEEK